MSAIMVLTGILFRLIALYKTVVSLRSRKDWRIFVLAGVITASLVHLLYWNGFSLAEYSKMPFAVSTISMIYGVFFVFAVSINNRLLTAYEEKKRALTDHVNLFEQFAYSAPLACFIIQDNRIVFSNHAASNLTGYSVTELGEIEPHTIAHQDSVDFLVSLESARDNDITSFETSIQLVTKNGDVRWGLATFGTAVYYGQPATVGTILDVTQQKNSEQAILEAEERIRMATNASNTMIWDVNLKTEESKFVVPDDLKDEFSFDEGRGREAITKNVYEGDRAYLENTILECVERHEGFTMDYRRYNRAGELRWWRLDGKAQLDENGAPVRVIGTGRYIHEQKVAEEALRENEARLRLATEIAGIMVWEWDISKNRSTDNAVSAFEQIQGFEDFICRVHPDHCKRVQKSIEKSIRKGRRFQEEFPLLDGDGNYYWQHTVGQLLYDEKGSPVQMIGVAIDTTERRKKDELIHFQADLLNKIGQSVVAQNASGEITYLNKAAKEALNLEAFESLPIDLSGLLPDKHQIVNNPKIMKALKKGNQWAGEVTTHTLSGASFPVFLSTSPLFNEKGEFDGFVSISTDLSAYKEIQEALQDSEERLRLAIDAASLVVWDLNLETGEIINNIPSSIDTKEAEKFSSLDSIMSNLHEDDREQASFRIAQSMEKKKPFYLEHRFINRDGSFDWWQSSGKLYSDHEGRESRMIGTSQMITLRKEAELLLQHRMHQLQAIYHVVDAVNKAESLETIYLTAADGARKALGVDKVAILTFDGQEKLNFEFLYGLSEKFRETSSIECPWNAKENWTSPIYIPEAAGCDSLDDIRPYIEEEGIQSLATFPLTHKDQLLGKFVIYFESPNTLTTSDKQLATRLANHISIALVKAKDERALKASEAKNKAILEALPDIFFHVNADGVLTDYKASENHKLIVPGKKIIGSKIVEVLKPEFAEKAVKKFSRTVDTQTLQVLEYELGLEEENRFFEARFAPAGAENVLIVVRDITDRKRAENALFARTFELQTIADTIPDSILRIGTDLKVKFANRAILEPTNASLDDFIGRDVFSIVGCPLNVHEKCIASINRVINTKEMVEFDFDLEDPVRGLQHYLALLAPEAITGDNVDSVLVVLRNMTEERRLQQSIIDISARQQRRIGQDLHDELGQLLTGIGFKIAGLQHDLEAINNVGCVDQTLEISRLVERAIGQTRTLAEGLNPVTLEVHGLRAGLEKLALNTENTFGVTCPFSCDDDFHVDDEEIAVQVYRIGQEAINNAIKHGNPSQIDIALVQTNGEAELVVRDDGKGFVKAQKRSDGQGLRIMDYRARVIGASVQIDSEPERGTTVRCKFKNNLPVSESVI